MRQKISYSFFSSLVVKYLVAAVLRLLACCCAGASAPSAASLASIHQAAKLVAALLRVAVVTAGLAESNGSLYRRIYDSPSARPDKIAVFSRVCVGGVYELDNTQGDSDVILLHIYSS